MRPRRPKRLRAKPRPTLYVADILAWADEHRERTGKFPIVKSGIVAAKPDENWSIIDNALRNRGRGLPRNWSLAQLLAERRGYRNPRGLPKFQLATILVWADEHRARTGKFPTATSGTIVAEPDETWRKVDQGMRKGMRGLRRGSSLSQLLAEHRGQRKYRRHPQYSLTTILQWADAHHKRTGRFPILTSGSIPEAPGETWGAVHSALRQGIRGSCGGSSLARLLAKRRHVRNKAALPKLTIDQVLHWADQHKARTANWPTRRSGLIAGSPGDTWIAVETALRDGHRGLRGGGSLARLLAKRRGVRRGYMRKPPLELQEILRWAKAHRKRTRRWPKETSGPIVEAPGETWRRVQLALKNGRRGLPKIRTIADLLARNFGVRSAQHLPELTVRLILKWVAAHHRRHGKYPKRTSGPIPDSGGETWQGVYGALYLGRRGLSAGQTLATLLAKHYGVRNKRNLPKLKKPLILKWVAAYHRRHGADPTRHSGLIGNSGGETWGGVDQALQVGGRGLPSGSSLSRLISSTRRARGLKGRRSPVQGEAKLSTGQRSGTLGT